MTEPRPEPLSAREALRVAIASASDAEPMPDPARVEAELWAQGYRVAERARPPQAEGLRATAEAVLLDCPDTAYADQYVPVLWPRLAALRAALRAEPTRDGLDALRGEWFDGVQPGPWHPAHRAGGPIVLDNANGDSLFVDATDAAALVNALESTPPQAEVAAPPPFDATEATTLPGAYAQGWGDGYRARAALSPREDDT
jgi:hypothetical protein